MIFLFDRCLAERLARMVDAYEVTHEARFLDDYYPKMTPDVEWINGVAAWPERPVVITADKRMRRNPIERKALAASQLTLVFFKAGFHDLPMHTQAVNLLRIWPDIVLETLRVREPTAFEIAPACRKVELLGRTARLAD